MVTTRNQIAHLIAPGLREVIITGLKQYPEEFSQLLNVNTSKRKYEDDYTFSGLGSVPEKTEGASVSYADPTEGYTKRYTHLSYGLGFRVTREAYDDDLYGIVGNKMSKALARSAKNRYETVGFSVFNNAFSASYVGGDAVALCSTVHPLANAGGTYSNRLATDSDLGVTSLRSALTLFDRTVDDDNLLIQLQGKTLLVPPEERYTARELLKSDGKPDTANRAYNAFADEDLSYFVGHYLTDTDAWFLMARKDETSLNFFWRIKPQFTSDDDFDTGDAKFKVYFRCTSGFSDWRGIVGTPGA